MTAIDPAPRALPEIGQSRLVWDLKMGDHVLLDGRWRLLLKVRHRPDEEADSMLVIPNGREERVLFYPRTRRFMARTPEEWIQSVEDARLAAPPPPPGRGYGPVSQIHQQQRILAALGESATSVCPLCGGAIFEGQA